MGELGEILAMMEARDYPDVADGTCCYGSAVLGYQYCTCWECVYDQGQQEPRLGMEPQWADSMCADCAFRPGSPERTDSPHAVAGSDDLLRVVADPQMSFWCHRGYDVPIRVGAWILRRLMPLPLVGPNGSSSSLNWENVSSILGDGLKRATAGSVVVDAKSLFTVSLGKLSMAGRSLPSLCTDATTPLVSRCDISSPEAALRTTLTWLQRGGLTTRAANSVAHADSPTRMLLRSVADALLAKRCDPSVPRSAYPTLMSADSPDRCDALFSGMRQVIAERHPCGVEIARPPQAGVVAYRPPIVDGVPYQVDGTPGLRCAGLAAARRAKDWLP